MKTKTIRLFYCILITILFAIGKADAQMVYLPDTNFRNALISQGCGPAIYGDSIDASSLAVTSKLYLNVAGWAISDLSGVEAFVNIYSLVVINNQLTSLPNLPASVTQLSCQSNNISSLPVLPTGLNTLNCSNNQLSALPPLPHTLNYLYCSHNQLSVLPSLPSSLFHLECDNNITLNCLPKLPNMQDFIFYSTGITCIPNHASIIFSIPLVDTFPLCDIFNTNSCNFYWNISGLTYSDSNANCIYDNADYAIKNIPMQLLSSGNLIQQTSSRFDGKYDFDTDSSGIYEVKVDTNDLPFDVICPAGNLYSDTITSVDSLKTGRDFSLQCKSGLQVGIKSIYGRFVPARFSTVKIHVEDLSLFYGMHCASGENGVVTTRLDGPVSYISPAPGALTPTTVSGNLLTYIVPDFGALYIGAFDIIVQTDTFATIGTQVCITVTTITTNTGPNIRKDSLHQCFTIVGSFDPNDKQVSPVSDVDINGDGWLIYTINFQNTGTAQAYDIYVLDTLDNNLDWSTFKLVDYSHQPQIQLFNTGLLRFNFPNINLPDSNANEPLSHGYVQYKVKLKSGLSVGTQIHNTAYIYFDFNQPVVTNTTQNVLVPPTAIAEIKNETGFNFFPNPAHDIIYVSLNKLLPANSTITINDMQGRMVGEKNTSHTNENTSRIIPINVSALSGGVYLMRINGQVQRFVKM